MAKLYSVSVNDLKISLLAVNFLLVSENVEHFLPKPAFLLQRVSRLGQGLGSAATHLRIFWLEVFEEWGLLFKILNLQQNIHQSGSSEIMNQKLLSHKPFKQLLEKKIFYFWTVTKSREREYVMCDVCLLSPLLWDVWSHMWFSDPGPQSRLLLCRAEAASVSPTPACLSSRPLTTQVVARKRGNRESTTLSITDSQTSHKCREKED